MRSVRMVRLLTVAGPFHARVVAARLGAEGILAELRGGLDGPYPMGTVDVWVPETDLDAARELLLADEIEAALAGDTEPEADLRAPPALWVLLAVLLLVALLTAAFAHR